MAMAQNEGERRQTMTRKAHCGRQSAIEFDLNIPVHEPAVALELGLKKREVGAGKTHTHSFNF